MKCIFYFLLFSITLNAQSVFEKDASREFNASGYNLELHGTTLSSSDVFSYQKPHITAPDTPYLYAPLRVFAYTSTDTGLTIRKDSTHYNSKGILLFQLTQFNNLGVWENSHKDTFYTESANGGEIYYFKTFEWQDSIWIDYETLALEYDSDGKILSSTMEKFYSQTYPIYKIEYIYTGASLAQMITYRGTADSLTPINRTGYSYNPSGKTTEIKIERWNNEWENFTKENMVYDGNDFLIEYSLYMGDNTDWKLLTNEIYENNTSGKDTLSIRRINTDSGLVNLGRTSSIYDGSGMIISETGFTWLIDKWVLSDKIEYAYNDMNLETINAHYVWIDSAWLLQVKYTSDYDESGALLSYITEYGSNPGANEKIEYTYDSFGNRIKGESFGWRDTVWVGENGSLSNNFAGYFAYLFEAEYEYVGGPIAVDVDGFTPSGFALRQNYPNPFNPETKINFTLPQSGKAALRIYDILGREVAELVNGSLEKGTHTVSFSGKQLSSGVYIYRLQSGAFTESKKMMLIK